MYVIGKKNYIYRIFNKYNNRLNIDYKKTYISLLYEYYNIFIELKKKYNIYTEDKYNKILQLLSCNNYIDNINDNNKNIKFGYIFMKLICKNINFINNKVYYTHSNRTYLDISCIYNNIKYAKLLLKYGINPNIKNNDNKTAIYIACGHINYKLICLLLKYNASVNIYIDRKNKITPLIYFINSIHKTDKINDIYLCLSLLLHWDKKTNLSNHLRKNTYIIKFFKTIFTLKDKIKHDDFIKFLQLFKNHGDLVLN